MSKTFTYKEGFAGNPNEGDHFAGTPPSPRTFSEQDLLDTWDAGWGAANDDQARKFKWSDEIKRAEKQQFFKQKFGIEIK